jgi:diguanylate cyclase (GGDEF)-like protein
MSTSDNFGLIALSMALATLDAYVAFSVSGRLARTHGWIAALWLGFGAMAMGSGVWAMHFLGMLADSRSAALDYDPVLTVGSGLVIVLTCAIVLWLMARHAARTLATALAGLVLGLGMGAMHVVGLLAMRVQPGIVWHPLPLAVLLLSGVLGSAASLQMQHRILRHRWRYSGWARLVAAATLGFTATAIHYAGRLAATIPAGARSLPGRYMLDGVQLCVLVSLVSGLVLLVTLAVSLAHRQLEQQTRRIRRDLDRARDALSHQAFHDALTALPNRASVLQQMEELLPVAAREGFEVAVMFIDLDGFKSINDTLGHEAGDHFLRMTANALRASVRARDTVARFGGDEFVIVLERFRNRENLDNVCEKILSLVSRPVHVAGRKVMATPSIGVATFPHDGHDAASLLRHADIAMYAAKQRGKASYCFYEARMIEQASERLALSSELREGLDRGEIRVHYQPKVHLPTRQLVGLEALARWQHPSRGLLSPSMFIALAEECGLIAQLGEYVLRQVTRQLAHWRDLGLPLLPVAVNLSMQEIRGNHFVETLLRTLHEAGLSHAAIDFEITESVAMSDGEHTLKQLRKLETLGFHMAIDDFGTGFSSLSHLRQLPIRTIKIDQSFVQGAHDSHADREITEAIIALAKKLRLQTIAEGIETEEQARWLTQAGCDIGQGFLFARPLSAEAIPALLRRSVIADAARIRA